MQRPIVGYGEDEEGVPIAILSCGHPQHIRHNPPFFNRPWVLTETGRASMLGQPLNCVRCDDLELPSRFVAYERTPLFDETTMPPRLRQGHATAVGVWARVVVTEGRLRYRVLPLSRELDLSPGHPGTIAPEVVFSLEPVGHARFFLEIYWTAQAALMHVPAARGLSLRP